MPLAPHPIPPEAEAEGLRAPVDPPGAARTRAAGWLAPRPPSRRPARRGALLARLDTWRLSTWIALVGLVSLFLHELLYHLTIDTPDWTLTVLAADHAVFLLSHGGLDWLASTLVSWLVALAWELRSERRASRTA